MMSVKSNLENLYDHYLGKSFDLAKCAKGSVSPSAVLCALVYNKLNQCALQCLKQIKNAADGKKIFAEYESKGIHFPLVIDSHQFPGIQHQVFKRQKVAHKNIFNGDELNAQAVYGLTPLHLAVIRGSHDFVGEMLESGLVDVNAQDQRGWTAMHHAALRGDREMMDLLTRHRGDPTVLNHRSGNPDDLLRLCSPIKVNESEPLPFVVWKENHEQRPLTFAEFKKIARAEYLQDYDVDPSLLLKDWQENVKYQLAHSFFSKIDISRRFSDYRKNPPQLILEQDPQLGLDVKTASKLMKGQGVTEYVGKVVPRGTQISNIEYALENVDSSEERNLGPIINDGFPNVSSITEINAGMERHFMFMIDHADAGERLCWNYGSGHDVKCKIPHVEPRKEAMLNFFREHSFRQLAVEIKRAFKNRKISDSEALDIYSKCEKVKYIIDTPTSLMHLIFTQVVTLKDFEVLLNDKELRDVLNISPTLYRGYQEQMLPIIRKFMELLILIERDSTLESKQVLRRSLIEKLDKFSLERNLGFYEEMASRIRNET